MIPSASLDHMFAHHEVAMKYITEMNGQKLLLDAPQVNEWMYEHF